MDNFLKVHLTLIDFPTRKVCSNFLIGWLAVVVFYLMTAFPVFAGATEAEDRFYLKDGDRVVFYGDSITDHRPYPAFVEDYVATRFPDRNILFVNAGWAGDTVRGGRGGPIDLRLVRDVIVYQPTVVTIMLGMNDGEFRPFTQSAFDTYANGYRYIIETLKAALLGIRMILIQPSAYDDVTQPPSFKGGYNAVLVRYGQFVAQLAHEESVAIVDFNTPLVTALKKAQKDKPIFARKIIPDRIHPYDAGHWLMCEALLKAWHAPSIVTAVEIDALSQHVIRAENTTVSGFRSEGTVSWMQEDRVLPLPVDMSDKTIKLVLSSSDFFQTLDEQLLKIVELTASNYDLKINGDKIGTFTKKQLAEGINLALFNTPMIVQAMAVQRRVRWHDRIHELGWKDVRIPLSNGGLLRVRSQAQDALNALEVVEADILSQQREMMRGLRYRYELIPKKVWRKQEAPSPPRPRH